MNYLGRTRLLIVLVLLAACTVPSTATPAPKAAAQLAFEVKEGDQGSIYVLAIGQEKPYLVADDIVCMCADEPLIWSPDGRAIAYLTGTTDKQSLRIVTDIDEVVKHRYTLSPELVVTSNPAWNPTDASLVFSARWNGKEDIFVWHLQDNAWQDLTTNVTGASRFPTWSPDGKWIAFSTYPSLAEITPENCPEGCLGNLYIMRADGTGIFKVSNFDVASRRTGRAFEECHPLWSPDSQYLAFDVGCNPNADPENIYVLDVVRRNLAKATHMEDQPLELVSLTGWLPDDHVVYAIPNIGPGPLDTLFVSKPDGTDAQKLVSLSPEDSKLDLKDLSWNKQGTQVVGEVFWHRTNPETPEIAVLHRDSGEVDFTGVYGSNPRWSPTGDSIAYQDSQGIGLMSADQHVVKQLTDYQVDTFAWAPSQ